MVQAPISPHARVDVAEAALIEATVSSGHGHLTAHGALAVSTAPFTGRSPADRFLVVDRAHHDAVWWGDINRAITSQQAQQLANRVRAHLANQPHYLLHASVNADPQYAYHVQLFSESPWHTLFAKHLFRDAVEHDAETITVLHAPTVQADPIHDGTRSGVFIVLDIPRRTIVIGGTAYAGEIKKAVFTMLNFLLPMRGVLPMHAGVNVGVAGDAAVFFGLSGTGKTTLSTDAERPLVGDDEHGWSAHGVFNFEGGCYAKTIRLSPSGEPEIYRVAQHFGTVLENVAVDPVSHMPDFDDVRMTENGRAAYPLAYLDNVHASGICNHPKTIFMLTADAFGVLPPVSRLTTAQAMYHFVSGYTAKVAGTERGVNQPTATFSACFGAPFMVLHPSAYAELLREHIEAQQASVWLVNTGWIGGDYGVGRRMELGHTRALIRAVLRGALETVTYHTDPIFGLAMPTECPDVPASLLDPRLSWAHPHDWQQAALQLAARFHANVAQLGAEMPAHILAGGPQLR